ncbi:hypothetical protein DFP80_11323 [Marinomonas rhizomae]|uniref:Uncharacterized protein n=1 Tax=Marinomonas rhizomae TaxID=491948 RepID=A0A366IYA9_9GAMM|nr:hypothetical protein DFP80_11323 [Marinomonas rhizomae]
MYLKQNKLNLGIKQPAVRAFRLERKNSSHLASMFGEHPYDYHLFPSPLAAVTAKTDNNAKALTGAKTTQ